MIDTQELGASSYPQAPEEKWNCYFFVAETSSTIKGYVWASSAEEAEKLVEKGEYEEIEERNEKVEEITNIERVEQE